MAYKINPFTTNFDYYESGSTIINASGVTYDNISSGLSSTDVQGAIDELGGLISGITETQDLQAVLTLGNSAGSNNINMNNNDLLNADKISFFTGTTDVGGVGHLKWDNADGTLEFGMKGGNVTQQIGLEQFARVVNKTSPLIDLLEADYQVVRISGAQGQRLAIRLAQANNDMNSATTLGVVTENIARNQEGFITTFGLVRGINTTGALQGETWADGDVLYLSPTIAGRLTNIKPIAPQHLVIVGYVEYAHNNNGKIFVKVDNGYELNELHDVAYPTTPANNEVLTYNLAQTRWENKKLPVEIQVACSDETTAITAGTNKVTFRMPHAMTLTSVRASLTTAQTSGNIFTVDVNEGGSSILSTKLTIDNTEKTSVTALTAAVISDTSLADDAEITIDVDQIGDGTAKGLKITLIGTR